MNTLRIALCLVIILTLAALTGCSAKNGEVTDGALDPSLPAVTEPAVTVPSATVSPTAPADNGILSTEPPAAEATATPGPVA